MAEEFPSLEAQRRRSMRTASQHSINNQYDLAPESNKEGGHLPDTKTDNARKHREKYTKM
jgi:hypothetical protein